MSNDLAERIERQLRQAPAATGTVHNFGAGSWGHDATFEPKDDGLAGSGFLWLEFTPLTGDQIIIRAGGGHTSRYRLVEVTACGDPPDMYRYQAVFDPRTSTVGPADPGLVRHMFDEERDLRG